jgi:glutamate carboxypeptidase
VASNRAIPDFDAIFAPRSEQSLDELRRLVEIESPSGDADGIGRVAAVVASELERLGAWVDLLPTHRGPNLLGRFGPRDGARPTLVLGHLDTVWSVGTLATMPWRLDDGKAYGPGVFDMKAGIVLTLEVLRALARLDTPPAVTVLLTCDEEIGSGTSRGLLEREALASRAVLVLEPPLPGGGSKTSRAGVAGYGVRVTGRAAHAGLDPEKGVSAIGAIASIVTRLHALSDLGAGLSVNVGTISGGTRSNVVAAEAVADVDVRFRTAEQAERVDAAIRAIESPLDGAVVEVTGGVNRPPFERSEATMSLFEIAREAAAASGIDLAHGHVGGASDGNYTAALGVPTLDGLGADGAGAHAVHEHVVVADLPRRSAMLARLVLALGS